MRRRDFLNQIGVTGTSLLTLLYGKKLEAAGTVVSLGGLAQNFASVTFNSPNFTNPSGQTMRSLRCTRVSDSSSITTRSGNCFTGVFGSIVIFQDNLSWVFARTDLNFNVLAAGAFIAPSTGAIQIAAVNSDGTSIAINRDGSVDTIYYFDSQMNVLTTTRINLTTVFTASMSVLIDTFRKAVAYSGLSTSQQSAGNLNLSLTKVNYAQSTYQKVTETTFTLSGTTDRHYLRSDYQILHSRSQVSFWPVTIYSQVADQFSNSRSLLCKYNPDSLSTGIIEFKCYNVGNGSGGGPGSITDRRYTQTNFFEDKVYVSENSYQYNGNGARWHYSVSISNLSSTSNANLFGYNDASTSSNGTSALYMFPTINLPTSIGNFGENQNIIWSSGSSLFNAGTTNTAGSKFSTIGYLYANRGVYLNSIGLFSILWSRSISGDYPRVHNAYLNFNTDSVTSDGGTITKSSEPRSDFITGTSIGVTSVTFSNSSASSYISQAYDSNISSASNLTKSMDNYALSLT